MLRISNNMSYPDNENKQSCKEQKPELEQEPESELEQEQKKQHVDTSKEATIFINKDNCEKYKNLFDVLNSNFAEFNITDHMGNNMSYDQFRLKTSGCICGKCHKP